MAMIKSALELALERTKDMKVDEGAIEAQRLRIEGKKAAGKYLEDPKANPLDKGITASPKEGRKTMREGAFEVLASQFQLPSGETSLEKLETLRGGFVALASTGANGLLGGIAGPLAEKKIQTLFEQLAAFFRQYLDDMKNVEQVIRKQWGPKLREKEREMSARMGQDVRFDPMMDPEFSAFYKQNVGAVRQQYQAALEKAKVDLASMLGIEIG